MAESEKRVALAIYQEVVDILGKDVRGLDAEFAAAVYEKGYDE